MTKRSVHDGRAGIRGGSVAGLSATILVLMLGAALAGGAYVVAQEWLSYRAEAIFAKADGDPNQRLKAMSDIQNVCGERCPARVWLAASALLTQAAAGEASPTVREGLIVKAMADARQAESHDPANGDATLQRAYLTLILSPDPTARPVLKALQESYRKAPFSLKGGWRLVYAGRHWAALDKPLRVSILDEAAWLIEIKPRLRPEVEAAFVDEAGQFALSLRLSCTGRCAPAPAP